MSARRLIAGRTTWSQKLPKRHPERRVVDMAAPRAWNGRDVHSYLLSITDPTSPLLETYRRLYKKVSFFQKEKNVRNIGLTSATVGEGKTLTSINLALAVAEDTQNQVVLMDCDFRRPKVASYLGMAPHRGLADVIQRNADPRDVMVTLGPEKENLHVLPLGKIRGDLEKEIYSALYEKKLEPLLASLKKDFDFVIIDTPPILPIVDIHYLSELLDGLILVVRTGKTSRDLVQHALETLDGKNIIGMIVNGVTGQLSSRYQYGSYYYSPYASPRSTTRTPPSSSKP